MTPADTVVMNSSKTTENRALKRAIAWAGSREGLAAECRVSSAAVHLWEKEGHVSRPQARLIALMMGKPRMEAQLRVKG